MGCFIMWPGPVMARGVRLILLILLICRYGGENEFCCNRFITFTSKLIIVEESRGNHTVSSGEQFGTAAEKKKKTRGREHAAKSTTKVRA